MLKQPAAVLYTVTSSSPDSQYAPHFGRPAVEVRVVLPPEHFLLIRDVNDHVVRFSRRLECPFHQVVVVCRDDKQRSRNSGQEVMKRRGRLFVREDFAEARAKRRRTADRLEILRHLCQFAFFALRQRRPRRQIASELGPGGEIIDSLLSLFLLNPRCSRRIALVEWRACTDEWDNSADD